MPRAKVARKSTRVDMTPMSDVAFLLLTFFMLTTKFKPDDPVKVITPSAISTTLLPESNVAMVTISKDGKVFFGLSSDKARSNIINAFNQQYNIGLSPSEMHTFTNKATVGVPLKQLKQFLDLPPTEAKNYNQPGIPIDSAKGELGQWLSYTVGAVQDIRKLEFVVKADVDTKYSTINRVLEIFKDKKLNKLHLITSMKGIPAGTPAYETAHSGEK